MKRSKSTMVALLGGSLLAALGTTSTFASDGVIEINQAAATAGGVTAGDGAGLPVTISQPGSYRLTGNLTLPNANSQGVVITSSDVTLDLGGFAIVGPGIGGSGDGIGSGPAHANIEVRNGTVEGLGRYGVGMIGANNRVVNVRVLNNGLDGILLGSQSLVQDCTASFNDGSGISTGPGGSVIENVATQNGIVQPSAAGIVVGLGSLVIDNIARNNTGAGVVTGDESNVIGNVLQSNSEDGARTGDGSMVKNNTASGNGGLGLKLGANNGYVSNVLTSNSSGSVSGGTELGTNFCKTDTVCP